MKLIVIFVVLGLIMANSSMVKGRRTLKTETDASNPNGHHRLPRDCFPYDTKDQPDVCNTSALVNGFSNEGEGGGD
ncbi:hypothetical protein MA16_Dca016406 [Dendrobium catenatum]|uniref:Uncharacterized protein n=1 Tax=Dendrobium catenatum TaxID=906689 RepID=A0A2I0VVA6_9ASPA|nr:hypothetical protein MA16_Dca016406 [Dendrobium catenatum]